MALRLGLSGNSDTTEQAIIDIGSNTVRLVIYGGPRRAPAVLYNEKVTARLGKGVAEDGNLSEKAMANVLAALGRFEALLRLRWLPPEALRVPDGARSPLVLRTAVHELRAINARAAPEDKLACLASACTVLYKALAQHARRTAGAGAQPASADDFLPALMYAVLQAAPPRLVSNIAYIERFRDSDQLLGVAGYCLTNLRSCMQYLRTLDAAALNMDAAAFEARCAAAAAGRAPPWLDTV